VTPTRGQIEEAQKIAQNIVTHGTGAENGRAIRDAFTILLAATAPPTDEELAEEAAGCPRRENPVSWHGTFRDGYVAGARREGRQ
jgi:hypothetical protein